MHQSSKNIFGHLFSRKFNSRIANPSKSSRFAEVIKTEEKGSDVNLSVHLLNDAWLDVYDSAIVVSNDSDIAEAMKLVKLHLHKQIGLITPGKRHPSQQLICHADFHHRIREPALKISQLPSPIPGTNIRKPDNWQLRRNTHIINLCFARYTLRNLATNVSGLALFVKIFAR